MNEFARSVFRCGGSLLLAGLLAAPMSMAAAMEPGVMPLPAGAHLRTGRMPVTAGFRAAFSAVQDARLNGALARMLRAMEERSGLTFARTPTGDYLPATGVDSAQLVIECAAAGEAIPQLGEDEAYTLEIGLDRVRLRAATGRGVLHGLVTLQQWLRSDAGEWFFPAASITDWPRFPWRGLMIDVCRHWQPMEVIKRNLDGMALVKLNVLHLHLTEDQGFRIESKNFPRLHGQGSDGHFFTQDEMRELIAYAAARGIRIVPEFDMPGHATSWLVGHPELGSAPGPYQIERKWGVFDPVLDPSNEEVYRVLDGFLGEMAALFPDPYLHIGGDENNGKHWSANAHIQQFIREHNLKDNAGLHAYFNQRVNKILAKHGKKLVGWDEILHPDLPAGSVVHSWRGPEGIADATKRGFQVLLSNGYYIDLNYPAAQHYLNDPAPASAALTDAQRALVLGGEATMWAEWVTPELIDSRIWPRTAAIAERLWSPVNVRDVPDMYRRLSTVAQRLEEIGLHHERYLQPAIRRLAGDRASNGEVAHFGEFLAWLEPVKGYARGGCQPAATQFTPLTGLVDCTRPDSEPARVFSELVDQFLANPGRQDLGSAVINRLGEMHNLAVSVQGSLDSYSPAVGEIRPLLDAVAKATSVATLAVQALQQGKTPVNNEEVRSASAELRKFQPGHAAVEYPALPALLRLIEAKPK
ncbi:MAG TPA: family 20 glycosylhydrolase [Lacunisphaera sp.]|nr:family 20 glycosylhydrolase [Lacunisphaera sp.]